MVEIQKFDHPTRASFGKNPHGRPLAARPDHETDFAASPSTAQCRGAAGLHECRPSLRGGLQGRRLTCPAKPAELSACNRWRTEASNIRPPDGRQHDWPDASLALRNGIASGPKRGSPANAIPVPGSESPQTPFDPGTAGDGVRCARQKKSFMPKSDRILDCFRSGGMPPERKQPPDWGILLRRFWGVLTR